MKYFFYFISFIGGANLLAFELITSKLIAPIFGTSFHVWSVTLLVTLLGIALGYFLSSKLMNFKADGKILILIHIAIAVFVLLISLFGKNFLMLFLDSSFLFALIFSVILLFLPIYLLFGTISPLMISFISNYVLNPESSASRIFAISTMGGVIGIYLFGFYLIPMKGLSFVLLIVQMINALNLLLLLLISFTNKTKYAK